MSDSLTLSTLDQRSGIKKQSTASEVTNGSISKSEISDEISVFKEIRSLQQESTKKGIEMHGYYTKTNKGYNIIVLSNNNASSNGIDHFNRLKGTVPFHTHPSKTNENKIDSSHNDLAENLYNIPSEADIIGFLSAKNNEEIVCTELFTIKFKKTEHSPKDIEDKWLDFCMKQPAISAQLLKVGALHEVFLHFYSNAYYSGIEKDNPFKYWNSSSYIGFCKDVFKLEVSVYDKNNRKLTEEDVRKYMPSRELTANEQVEVERDYNNMQTIVSHWLTYH